MTQSWLCWCQIENFEKNNLFRLLKNHICGSRVKEFWGRSYKKTATFVGFLFISCKFFKKFWNNRRIDYGTLWSSVYFPVQFQVFSFTFRQLQMWELFGLFRLLMLLKLKHFISEVFDWIWCTCHFKNLSLMEIFFRSSDLFLHFSVISSWRWSEWCLLDRWDQILQTND